MFTIGKTAVTGKGASGIPPIIIRGPPSFGFLNSRMAGKNMIKIKIGVPRIKIVIIEVRFGIITIFEEL